MGPQILAAKSRLSIPLYAVDFDPENADLLVAGGGGGESKSGVGNKLILLRHSKKTDLEELAEAELSRDEDSVTSLAVANPIKEGILGIIAGINSSTVDQQANKNEHLRSFVVTIPPSSTKSSTDAIQELGRASLFTPSSAPRKETYQRVLRLSPANKGDPTRLAAVATGLAPDGEVIAFKFDGSDPTASPYRISLKKGEEANDVDIIDTTGNGEFQLCYCTDHEAFLYQVGSSNTSSKVNPKSVYELPFPDVFEKQKPRRSFRAIRFLAPHLILILANYPGRNGAQLLVIRINDGPGIVILQKRLHKSFRAGTSLDVSNLSRGSNGPAQFVIAAAGIDSSIEVLTLDYHPEKGVSNLLLFSVLRDVHALQITKIAFSSFHPPSLSPSGPAPPQTLKLASVSLGNTLVVHTFPLTPNPPGFQKSSYILRTRKSSGILSLGVLTSLFVLLLSALLFQVVSEVKDTRHELLGVSNWLSPEVQSMISDRYDQMFQPPKGIQHVVAKAAGGKGPAQAVVMRLPETGEIAAELEKHADLLKHETVKKWEELKPREQAWWKKKLSDAGQWAADEGDSVLKNVFFSEVAGLVGEAVRG
ncbi:MAG: hypothetical protein M1814_003232 [Vezdaea aestivalis]|nr:MAG: hypothetical protein M1814_003232 [Vezdaea aestivalis]